MLLSGHFAKAQLSGADSVWFSQIFTDTKYADDSAFPGQWYMHDSIQSTAALFTQLDSVFKFTLTDFGAIDSMVVSDTMHYDTLRNNTYNNYPFVYQQDNPFTFIDYTLNGKNSKAFNFRFPKDSLDESDYAFLIVPGNGNNSATEIVQGTGYYNMLCYVSDELKSKGDVFAMMKPNEDARAIFWNQKKLNHTFLVSYLDSIKHQYGLNYLTELIATIKFLKQKYCKVVVLGLSEGGYSSLLASLVTHPDAAVISGGYSIGFDTSWSSYSILQQRFDSLVFTNNKTVIKNNILSNNTKYLFTWGDGDQVNLMQAEHDSNYTKTFFNDSTKIFSYCNFTGHTFPDCAILDTFIYRKVSSPQLHFGILDSIGLDSMITYVSNCSIVNYKFELFRNDTLYRNFIDVYGDTSFTLIDSGLYYLKSISSIYGDSSVCSDTIYFNKPGPVPVPNITSSFSKELMIYYNNPVKEYLYIKTTAADKPREYVVYDMYGNIKIQIHSREDRISVNTSQLPPGVYLLKVKDGTQQFKGKIIKH